MSVSMKKINESRSMIFPGVKFVPLCVLVLMVTLAGIVSISGCGDDDDDDSGSTPTPTMVATATPTPEPPITFEISFLEYSETSGIDIAENGPHGMAIADINGDNFDDVFITRCCEGMVDLLYVNNGNGSYTENAAQRGVSDSGGDDGGSHGALFFDYDNDGDYDLLSSGTNVPDRLYENDGQGYFTDVTVAAGLHLQPRQTRGIVAADMDLDGDQDVYLSVLACDGFMEQFEYLYLLNNGNGTFTKDDGTRGLNDYYWGLSDPCHGSQGLTMCDIDLDGAVDIYSCRIDLPNRMFMNMGNGYFTEEATERGIENNNIFTNGAVFGDFDNDGDFDLVLQDLDDSYRLKFYLNEGDGTFYNATKEFNLFSQAYSGVLADFDNDGDLDYYVAARGDEVSMIMFENDGSGNFMQVFDCGADFHKDDARTVGTVDFDNDGDLDILLLANRGGSNFLRNEANNNRFLKITLLGVYGNTGVFGSIVKIYLAGHMGETAYLRGMRYCTSSQGYLSQSSPVVHFGLGNNTQVADVEVIFPSGIHVYRYGIERGSSITISETEGL